MLIWHTHRWGVAERAQKWSPFRNVAEGVQGGIVGYIYKPGDFGYIAEETHGIIVSPTDLSAGIVWSPISYVGPRLSGTGLINTNLIVGVLGTGNYAARICYDLVQSGYSDWALPTNFELGKIEINKIDEDYLIDLKIDIDEKSGDDEEFEIETE